MQVEETELPAMVILISARREDVRGFFRENENGRRLAAQGIDAECVLDKQALSARAGTVRGLHHQSPPHVQGEPVHCGRGRLFDEAVDFRPGRPRLDCWIGAELGFGKGRLPFVPGGGLHGLVGFEPDTVNDRGTPRAAPRRIGLALGPRPGFARSRIREVSGRRLLARGVQALACRMDGNRAKGAWRQRVRARLEGSGSQERAGGE